MPALIDQLRERRIWRVLVAYPSVVFVLLQVVEFFINNYQVDSRFLTASLVAAVVWFPAAVLWNWRHGEVGRQSFTTGEVSTYLVLGIVAVLVAGWYWKENPASTPVASHDLAAVRSVAVMPFGNAGDDAEVQYLCDGIAESLINWLATVPDVRVISRSASFRLRDMAHDTAKLAKELGVDSIISGELERVNGNIVVSASMIDARDDSQIWGERLVKSGTDLISLERSIFSAIKDGLRLSIEDIPGAGLVVGGTENPAAYDAYLRGHFQIQSTNPESVNEGLEELRKAIRLDPKFARPYADIADALAQKLMYGLLDGDDLLGEARNAAYSAIALAPDLPEAHTALATIYQGFDFDWEAADREYATAVDLDPESPGPYSRYSDFLALTFQFEKSRDMAIKGLQKDAFDGSSLHALGFAYLAAGDFSAAAKAFGDWNRFHPESRWSFVKYAVALSLDGQCDTAVGVADRIIDMNSGEMSTLMESWLAWVFRNCGLSERAELLIQSVLARHGGESVVFAPGVAYVYALQGDTEKLVDGLSHMFESHDVQTIWIKFFSIDYLGWGVSGTMMENPRYIRMIEQLDYPQVADQN